MSPIASLLILAFGVLVLVNSAPVNDKLLQLGRIMSVTHRVRRDSTPPPPRPCINGTTTSPNGTTTSPNGTMTSPNGTTTSPNGTTTSPNGTTTSPNVGAVLEKIGIIKKKIIGKILSVTKRVKRKQPTVPNPRPC